MPVVFDFPGSLELAAKLVRLADRVEDAATARQGSRDDALSPLTFKGPFGRHHRQLADDHDAMIERAQACRESASDWARAWMNAANDHNDEMYQDALVRNRRNNEDKLSRHEELVRSDPEGAYSLPTLGYVWPPRASFRPSGPDYAPQPSVVTGYQFRPSDGDLLPVYGTQP